MHSLIYSDEWKAYNGIKDITGKNYTHLKVNHLRELINPATGAHTHSVESMWSQCERMMWKEQTMHSKLFDIYLSEFIIMEKEVSPERF